MKLTFLEIVLLIALVIGVVRATPNIREQHKLQSQLSRLKQHLGEFPVVDPRKLTIKRVKTTDRMHFAWRMRVPAEFEVNLREGISFYTSSSDSSQVFDGIYFLRFHKEDLVGAVHGCSQWPNDGVDFNVHFRYNYRSNPSEERKQFEAKIQAHWDDLEIESLPCDWPVQLGNNDEATLARIKIPSRLEAEFKAMLPLDLQSKFNPVLYEVHIAKKP